MLKPKEQYDIGPTLEGYAHTIIASQGPSPASEEQARQDLQINIHTIEDEQILRTLDALCVVKDEYKTIDTLTNIETTHIISYPRPWALALRVAVSKVLACRFLSKENATTDKLKLRNEIEKIKLSMNSRDLEIFSAYINMVLLYAETGIDDSVDGQKMMSLKVQHRELKVGLSKPGTK